MDRNKDSLLRAVGNKSLLACATTGDSCDYLDQSRRIGVVYGREHTSGCYKLMNVVTH